MPNGKKKATFPNPKNKGKAKTRTKAQVVDKLLKEGRITADGARILNAASWNQLEPLLMKKLQRAEVEKSPQNAIASIGPGTTHRILKGWGQSLTGTDLEIAGPAHGTHPNLILQDSFTALDEPQKEGRDLSLEGARASEPTHFENGIQQEGEKKEPSVWGAKETTRVGELQAFLGKIDTKFQNMLNRPFPTGMSSDPKVIKGLSDKKASEFTAKELQTAEKEAHSIGNFILQPEKSDAGKVVNEAESEATQVGALLMFMESLEKPEYQQQLQLDIASDELYNFDIPEGPKIPATVPEQKSDGLQAMARTGVKRSKSDSDLDAIPVPEAPKKKSKKGVGFALPNGGH